MIYSCKHRWQRLHLHQHPPSSSSPLFSSYLLLLTKPTAPDRQTIFGMVGDGGGSLCLSQLGRFCLPCPAITPWSQSHRRDAIHESPTAHFPFVPLPPRSKQESALLLQDLPLTGFSHVSVAVVTHVRTH